MLVNPAGIEYQKVRIVIQSCQFRKHQIGMKVYHIKKNLTLHKRKKHEET